jgi:hypothetical protein
MYKQQVPACAGMTNVFILSLAGGSAFQGRGAPSPRLRPLLSQRESFEIRTARNMPNFKPEFPEPLLREQPPSDEQQRPRLRGERA